MICHLCKINKLSNEFPHEHLTKECKEDHALLHCLRCAVASVKDHQECSQCKVRVKEDNVQYQQYVKTLEFLFPTVVAGLNVNTAGGAGHNVNTAGGAGHNVNTAGQSVNPPDESTSQIDITTLSGERITCVYNPDETIQSLKEIIEKELEAPQNKQRLMYNNIELKAREQNKEVCKLKDYDVQPNSTIYLIVLLYEIPDEFDYVVFDLFWGYPQRRRDRDYLDASVLLYNDSQFVEVVDYEHRKSQSCSAFCSAVKHSGDVMDDADRRGHHKINVSIKSIPANINKLVFTLSAWDSPNISKYPNPSLQFFDLTHPDVQLCSDEMGNAADSQAIIMCCLTKKESGWQVVSLKHPSAGNVKKYKKLKKSIVDLIEKGFI